LYPGADADTDHLFIGRIRVKSKIVNKGRKKHWNSDSVKETEKLMPFIEKLEEKIEQHDQNENDIERRWLNLKGKIKDTAEEVVGYKTGKRRNGRLQDRQKKKW